MITALGREAPPSKNQDGRFVFLCPHCGELLGHNTFTQGAVDLIVRSADGVLRQALNLGVGCLIEAVRGASKTIDIDNVNRVLMQPHWQKDADLVDY